MTRSVRRTRARLGAAFATSTILTITVAGSPAVSAPAPSGSPDGVGSTLLAQPLPAETALERLTSTETAEAASRNGWSVSRLVNESADATLWMDSTGHLFYVDDSADSESTSSGRVRGSATAPLPPARTFELHSLPGSDRSIYLDFNGHIVTGTAWNQSTGTDPQTYGAYDTDGNPNVYSAAEKTEIQQTWRRVAEDFAPFDVDVTTAEPPPGRIDRSDAADQVYGTRLLVTAGGDVYNVICGANCGGIAYIDVFDAVGATHSFYQPAFVFTDGVGTGAKNIAEAASHEIGHNLSLNHDGTSGLGYYAGHGAWAPIMGVGYYRPVSQWSQGEYADANNGEDDLARIQANGAPARTDDHGDTIGAATVTGGNKGKGVIGSPLDKDVFRITSTGGSYTISASPVGVGANLDISLRVMRPNGNPVAVADPGVVMVDAATATGLNAVVTQQLAAGKYFVQVRGTGFGDPASTGYSDYGSLGAFTVKAVK